MVELVLFVHLSFIAWAIAGGFLVIRRAWLVLAHAPALVWGVLLELNGWACPLTSLENALRRERGMQGYDGGFIEQYLVSVIYPDGLTRDIQLWLAAGLVLINVFAYALVARRHLFQALNSKY